MRVRDRVAHLNEQLDPFAQRRVARIAPVDYRCTVDVFHDGVRTPVWRDAAVEQARDAGMFESREDLPLGVKTRLLADRIEAQQLECAALGEPGVGARGGMGEV